MQRLSFIIFSIGLCVNCKLDFYTFRETLFLKMYIGIIEMYGYAYGSSISLTYSVNIILAQKVYSACSTYQLLVCLRLQIEIYILGFKT